jgi:hypothetical protein
MTLAKTAIPNTNYSILEERLSSLCKLYEGESTEHFAQFYVQSGLLGECVIKGLDGPKLPFKERRGLHEAMWIYVSNVMGYSRVSMQRVKYKPKTKVITIKKSLGRYKK